jgi:hypothetical protein
MTIKEIIQKLYTAITDSRGQESHFESWLTLNDGIIDAIDALKALDKQEPAAWVCYGSSDSEMHDVDFEQIDVDALPVGTMLYTTPPQPTQVKLTDDEIWKFWWARPEIPEGENDSMEAEFVAAVRAVLAAHGIKGD